MQRVTDRTLAPSVRDRILDAAEHIVAREGVRSLTLDAVAGDAGVSKGGLLYHFPSKAALIAAIIERFGCKCEADQARECAASSAEPGAFTRAYLKVRSEPIDPGERPIHTALLAAAGTDPELVEPIRERLEQWQKQLENDGIDPVSASIVRLAMDGLCLSTLLGMPVPEGELKKQILERLVEMTREVSREQ